ncbi:MAG: arylesterase [Alphaproteobacteria bacterium]
MFNLILAFTLFASHGEAASKRLLLLGDSLTAGYGLPTDQGFAAQLHRALTQRGHQVVVIDAGVSGDTSAGGLARLDWSLGDKPTHAMIELGANDALRGLPPAAMEQNLDGIIKGLKAYGTQVLLTGMVAPKNLGPDYQEAFEGAYSRLAKKHGIALYAFFLDGLADKDLVTRRALVQADGLHPNAQGVAIIVERILPAIEQLLASGEAS